MNLQNLEIEHILTFEPELILDIQTFLDDNQCSLFLSNQNEGIYIINITDVTGTTEIKKITLR